MARAHRNRHHVGTMRGLMIRLGIVAPDTPFNRRAKLYADTAVKNTAEQRQRTKRKVDTRP